MSNSRFIIDPEGNFISCGLIVQINKPHYHLHEAQGKVVCADLTLPPDSENVAVFFCREVSSHWELSTDSGKLSAWDEKHPKQILGGDISELFGGRERWKSCPRVVTFKPSELVVQEWWKTECVAKRLFRNSHYQYYEFKPDLPKHPNAYCCMVAGCSLRAVDMAYLNASGTVIPFPACAVHHSDCNGKLRDTAPAMKTFEEALLK